MSGFVGIGNVSPITASILAQPVQAVALKPGQILQGIVQSLEPQTLLRFGNVVIPVERVEGVQPGQAISAEVVQSSGGLQFRITPGGAGTMPSATPHSSMHALSGFIVDALRALGTLEVAEQAVHLIPPRAGQSASAVRLILGALLEREQHGEDAPRLLAILQSAVDEGLISEEDILSARKLLQTLSGREEILETVRQQGLAMSRMPLAARLAEAVAHGTIQTVLEAVTDDALAELIRIRDNTEFGEFLRRTGQHGEFTHGVERLVERFMAAQLINSRGADFPYLFFGVPVHGDSGVHRAHIHIMGDGGGKPHGFDAKNAFVVFDISTSSLGELWISLSISSGACSCWLRAQDLNAVNVLQSHSTTLIEHLAQAGYPNAAVHAALWNGDRVRELSTMMRRFNGINIQA